MKSQSILVPIAGAVAAEENAEYLFRLAQTLDSDILLLHVHSGPDPDEDGSRSIEIFEEIADDKGVNLQVILSQGNPLEEILQIAEEQDPLLIVMGASSDDSVENWISSDVLDQAEAPVVVIPHAITNL